MFKPGKPKDSHTTAWADKDTGIYYNPDNINSSARQDSRTNGWNISAGEGMPTEVQAMLPVILTVLHECGHQHESWLADECLRELPIKLKTELEFPDYLENIKKIKADYEKNFHLSEILADAMKQVALDAIETKLKSEDSKKKYLCFDTFICHKLVPYTVNQTTKVYGEKPTVGLIFKPGGKSKSISLYASTNTKDFYAELFAKVLLTHPNHLTPLGNILRNLLNSDGAHFKNWLQEEIKKDRGTEYRDHEKYFEKHSGYEDCPSLSESLMPEKLMSRKCLADELGLFGFKGELENLSSSMQFAIQFKLKSNYNAVWTEKLAEQCQRKLANAVTILKKLNDTTVSNDTTDFDSLFNSFHRNLVQLEVNEKFRVWLDKKVELLRISEYCKTAPSSYDLKDMIISNTYSCLDILETLAEKDPKDFETPEACREFLDKEIANVVGARNQTLKAQTEKKQASDSDKKGISVSMNAQSSVPPVLPVFIPNTLKDGSSKETLIQSREPYKK